MIRLSKMLRLARIKKILSKYGDDVDLQTYVSIGFNVRLQRHCPLLCPSLRRLRRRVLRPA